MIDNTDSKALTQVEPGPLARSWRDGPAELHRGASVGRYLIVKPLARGAMGQVYVAYDSKLDRKLALKLVGARRPHKDAASDEARLLREAYALGKLNHPNVVHVYDVGTHQGEVFIAQELVEGTDLRTWLKAGRRSWQEAREVFLQAAEGLAAAHEAGLVHRDFKPANVLLGSDGRVRVADFGLARASRGTLGSSDSDSISRSTGKETGESTGSLDEKLTRTGSTVGTPAYMAPEQHAGELVDEQADQFAFCVALCEALYGQRPFRKVALGARPSAAASGEVELPTRTTQVPGWLHRILHRGLRDDPQDRFPSMRELKAALRDDPARRRRRVGVGVGVGVAVALAAFATQTSWQRQQRRCQGVGQNASTLWGETEQKKVRNAIQATGVPYADDTWRRLEHIVGEYVATWSTARTGACLLRVKTGGQANTGLRRVDCLELAEEALSGLIEVLVHADVTVVERAVSAAEHLPRLEDCDDNDKLRGLPPPPDDPLAAGEVASLRRKLARVTAQRVAGKHDQARIALSPVQERAKALADPALLAEVLYERGRVEEGLGEHEDAVKSLAEAEMHGEAGRHDRVRAEASVRLVFLHGWGLMGFERAVQWNQRSAAIIARLGGDDLLEGWQHVNYGWALLTEVRSQDAEAEFRRGLVKLGRRLGPMRPDLAWPHNGLGNALLTQGRYNETIEHLQKAANIARLGRGAEHPEYAWMLYAVAQAMFEQGRRAEAANLAATTLAIRKRALGPDNVLVAVDRTLLGTALAKTGRASDALAMLDKNIAILERMEGAGGTQQAALVDALDARGRALLRMGRNREAASSFERAMGLAKGTQGVSPCTLEWTRTALARAYLALEHLPAAVHQGKTATAELEELSCNPPYKAGAAFVLAQSLWASGGSRERAIAAATDARKTYSRLEYYQQELAEVDRWLAEHGA